MRQLIKILCSIATLLCFIPQTYAEVVVNYYQTIAGFSSNNSLPQGNFVQGLDFTGEIRVKVSGYTTVKVVYSQGCNASSNGNWTRYILVPGQIADNSGNIVGTFTSNPEFSIPYLGITYNAYKIDTVYGYISHCTAGTIIPNQSIISTNTPITADVTLYATNPAAIVAGDYTFELPVRVVSVLNANSVSPSVWVPSALIETTNLKAIFTVPINNFCTIDNTTGYNFDFGSITEKQASELSMIPSNTQQLNIDCVSPATVELSFTATSPYNSTPNYVEMGSGELYADFYINNVSQAATTLMPKASSYSIPLKAELKQSSTATEINAGVYNGSGTLKITIQ